MSLITLTGTISESDLDNNFSDKVATLQGNAIFGAKDFSIDLEIFDLVTSTSVGLRTLDFTPSDDWEFRVFGFSSYSASAVPTVTVTLTAIDSDQNSASDYLLGQTISLSKQDAVGEANATRDDRQASSTTKIFLKKGVTYRIQASSDSATNTDRVHIYLYLRTRRRKA